MICPDCGWNNNDGNEYCSGCGKVLQKKPVLKIPQDRFSFWSQVFRELRWFDTRVFSGLDRSSDSEKVLFCHAFPRSDGPVKRVRIGDKHVRKGIICGFESYGFIYEFKGEKYYYFNYEKLITAEHQRNTIFLSLKNGVRLEMELNLPRPGFLAVIGVLFGSSHDRLLITEIEGRKNRESDEYIHVIAQFFIELIATFQ